MGISSTKIEHRALNVLESIIDDHSEMDHKFNLEDKEMSWDGYIKIFKGNSGEQSKRNFVSRVPVQIKGHIDEKEKYVNKKRITYAVEIDDLKIFSSEKGVLYFRIFMSKSQNAIFYTSLYPSKIADYLDIANQKKNKTSINIPFSKLEKNANMLFVIVKQFDEEAKRQGTAFTPTLKDRIRSKDFKELTSITLSVVGVKTHYDLLTRLSTGDVCLYGKTKGDKYERPLELVKDSKFIIGSDVDQQISIDGEVFYNSFRYVLDSDENVVLRPSPNLNMHIKAGTINFKANSSIEDIANDARFLLKLCKRNTFSVNGIDIKFKTIQLEEEFERCLEYIVALYETLKMIGIDAKVSINQFSDEEKGHLAHLIDIRLGTTKGRIKDGLSRYNFQLGGKFFPLLIDKNKDDIELLSAVYTDKYVVFLPDDEKPEEKGYRMPLFVYQDAEILSKLYKYDYCTFQKQIDDCDVNEKTAGALLEAILIMVNTFDICDDRHFLDLAQSLLEKICFYLEPNLYLLNALQIKKRRQPLGNDEIKALNTIDVDDKHIMFGKYVLLGNKVKADSAFALFSEKEKKHFYKYPMYALYLKL